MVKKLDRFGELSEIHQTKIIIYIYNPICITVYTVMPNIHTYVACVYYIEILQLIANRNAITLVCEEYTE